MRATIITILLLFSSAAIACKCKEINKSDFKDLVDNAHFVFIGSPVKNVTMVESLQGYLDDRKEGEDILVKVDSIIKGKFKSEFVYVNQAGMGDCIKTFKFDNSYLIVGYEIKSFKHVKTPMSMLNDSIPVPPPPPTYENGIMTDMSFSAEYVDFNNELIKTHTIITTNQCLSFDSSSNLVKELLDRKTKYNNK